ncbi:hypothetical protein AVEN_268960-1 [Araneus ventricosus]|uniref:Uncharacterized protein n=1 Tax=Araneus ventricosus TaxID=182803 RepID=A0A4Y2I195_ARAVE|nr:hypothetical protein AVEN_268960-1 [Araneus ventricosus]
MNICNLYWISSCAFCSISGDTLAPASVIRTFSERFVLSIIELKVYFRTKSKRLYNFVIDFFRILYSFRGRNANSVVCCNRSYRVAHGQFYFTFLKVLFISLLYLDTMFVAIVVAVLKLMWGGRTSADTLYNKMAKAAAQDYEGRIKVVFEQRQNGTLAELKQRPKP